METIYYRYVNSMGKEVLIGMVKGICKEFVTVKIKDNPIYDEAIFVLKRKDGVCKIGKSRKNEGDMLFEANRILCEQGVKRLRKRGRTLKLILLSSLLLILGGASGALITFFIIR